MKEQLISFETAKLAKEKGFESDVSNSIYTEIGELKDPIAQMDLMRSQKSIQEYFKLIKSFPSAPTQSLLQRWLREVHNIYIESNPNASGYGWFIDKTNGTHIKNCGYEGPNDGGRWDIYEEALEVGLQEALKLLP